MLALKVLNKDTKPLDLKSPGPKPRLIHMEVCWMTVQSDVYVEVAKSFSAMLV